MANNFESDFWEPVGRASRRNGAETYGRGDQEERTTTAGGVIVAFVALLSTVLVIAGLVYATGASARHKSALAADDCVPALFVVGLPCTNQRMEMRRYEGIVTPAIQQLATESAAYRANEGRNLAAAETALTAEVAAEQALDNGLTAVMYTPQTRATSVALITNSISFGNPIPPAAVIFSPQVSAMADALVRDIQALAKLTSEQARSSSLTQLRSFNARIQAATVAVQSEMQLISKAVETPPTASEEPCAPCF